MAGPEELFVQRAIKARLICRSVQGFQTPENPDLGSYRNILGLF